MLNEQHRADFCEAREAGATVRHRQSGAVLVVSMLLLLIVTILGIATATNTGTQLRMAHSIGEINIAFQAAEAALRGGEGYLQTIGSGGSPPAPRATCSAPCANTVDIWAKGLPGSYMGFDWTSNGRVYGYDYSQTTPGWPDSSAKLYGLPDALQPRFIVEFEQYEPDSLTVGIGVQSGRYVYRVTAQGRGTISQSEALVQSTFGVKFN